MNVEDIFYEAIKIASRSDRAAYLERACGRDARVREEVDGLLSSHDQAPSFLENGAVLPGSVDAQTQDSSCLATQPPPARRPIAEGPGTRVGRYKLLQEIGEGGMGVVYMAEQERPVRRRVALKIIKPGMDSAQVIARFEAERQALAMMDHPNIARVLDAGCTDTGRPYFVMELVQGVPVTKYCDEKQLSTRERLELFVQICHAIQHAHQKGIIHRDLKPSNVLVAIYDGKPMPKIIDFGVAKALHQRLTEATMFTQFGAVVGTLEYMSPEQAEMDALGTDTRSDIYSLGVLLYELLTGTTPLDGKKLRALGYAEMVKTIREVDPPKPSTRLSQSRQEVGAISARRHTEPRRLQKLIAGDLDWIVMKCLEKDRTRRYETANGLAMDIRRHLNDEAVTASPPGSFYKLQKLVRRNKLVFAAIGCVMAALVIGLIASLWQFGRAQREADRANAALGQLRAAAPSIAAEARVLASREKFDEAIDKLNYASQLQPDSADHLMHKADLLETQLRLNDAANVYRAALNLKPGHARARENAELCDQLAAAPKTADGKLTRESLARLNAQMLKDQRPAAEIMPVARLLGDEKKYVVSYWLDRLKDLPNGTDMPLDKRLVVRNDGLLDLSLGDTQIADLAPLTGMPLGTLNISGCTKVVDLSPLRGMRLIQLNARGTSVGSLVPLRGMRSLQSLDLSNTPMADLSPLTGLRLKVLNLDGSRVLSIEPLRGMPLEDLIVRYTGVTDLSPLAGMPLKALDVTSIAAKDFTPLKGLPLETCLLQSVPAGDLSYLRGAPLKQLTLSGATNLSKLAVLSELRTLEVLALPENFGDLPLEEFSAVAALRSHPSLKQLSAKTYPSLSTVPSKDEFWKNWERDDAWALRLKKAKLRFTRGQYVRDRTWWLKCLKQEIPSLSILDGAAISHLDLNGAKITDLTPLRSLPLTYLELDTTSVSDLSALRGLKLVDIGVYKTKVRDLSPLKDMPLKVADLRADQITDVSLMAEIPTLQYVLISPHATNIESLRASPSLKRISFSYGPEGTACTAETFWKTWDGLPWARKLEAAGISFTVDQTADGYYGVAVRDPKFADCSIFKGSSIRRLDLDKSSVVDLSPLAELPLAALSVRETPVVDLSPLRSALLRGSLRELRVWRIRATDFSPVEGCTKLELFDASDTAIADLSVLRQMKHLRSLLLARAPVTDISVVAGMPLEWVDLDGAQVADVSPLLKCPTLRKLCVPQTTQHVESLRKLPGLERLSFTANGGEPDKTADQFWAAYKAEEPWVGALREAGIAFKQRRAADQSWEVFIDDQPLADLSLLRGGNISLLSITRTRVVDLSPLRGSKVTGLRISGTKVTDLSPLKGMPLTQINLAGTEISDLSPLAGMPLRTISMTACPNITDLSPLSGMRETLEVVVLPRKPADIEFLREFPRLKRLSYRYDPAISGPAQTVEEFWAEYDKTKALKE